MSVNVNVRQVEGRRMEIEARGITTVIDDLIEDGGPGDGFRPTELLLGALGSCTIGTMLTFAKNNGIDVHDVRMTLVGEKVKAPTRVASITMRMEVEGDYTDKDLERLQRVAAACTVHNTLKNEPGVELEVVRA